MKLRLFNRKIEINISKNHNHTKIEGINKVIKRYLMLSFVLIATVFLHTYIQNIPTYSLNTVVDHDVISSKNVSYKIDLTTPSVVTEITQSTTPEYDVLNYVSEENLEKFASVVNKIPELQDNKIDDFIAQNKLKISKVDLENIISKSSFSYFNKLTRNLEDAYKKGISDKTDIEEMLMSYDLNPSERAFLENFIEKNLKFNEEKTKKRVEENLNKLKNSSRIIKIGDIIVKKGEKINNNNYQDLKKLGLVSTYYKNIRLITTLIFIILVLTVLYRTMRDKFRDMILSKSFIPSLITICIVNSMYLITSYYSNFANYITPLFMLPILMLILTKNRIFTFITTVLNFIILLDDYRFLLILLILTLYLVYNTNNIKSRQQIIYANIEVLIFEIILLIPYSIYINENITDLLTRVILILISTFTSIILSVGILPIFENTFKVLTDVRLLELADFSNPLLKKLLVVSPGTFHHSIMVGALAEHAAEAIGCNAMFVRVASYYHDIGKMKRPQYFIENQFNHINPHDKINPQMSANIIINHVHDGVLIANQYKLPEELIEIIQNHHGTTLVNFFYYKSLENNERIDISDFRYPGPKPVTKEASIIMLADSIEAAVRVKKDKSYDSIKELVQIIIKNKIEEGQLSDSHLTLHDINTVINSFMEVLQGAYHERIEYPTLQK